MFNEFLQTLNIRVSSVYGAIVPKPVLDHLDKEIAYLKALPENVLAVYLTVLDAAARCGHSINSPTPYQPCLIGYLYGLVKIDPTGIVPPEMCLAYSLDINLEVCGSANAFIVDALKNRFGEDRVVVHAQTENRLFILFDKKIKIKHQARKNRHGLLYEADAEESADAIKVSLLQHPLLEAVCAAQEETPLLPTIDADAFEFLAENGCIGGFDSSAVLEAMAVLKPHDLVSLARSMQIGIGHSTSLDRQFVFREDVFHALLERGMDRKDSARLARHLDQARRLVAEKEMDLLLHYVDQQFLDSCFSEMFRPSILSVTGSAHFAMVLTKLRMMNPGKYNYLSDMFYSAYGSYTPLHSKNS